MPFVERHAEKIRAVLSCFDRIVITGTIPGLCHSDGMSGFLRQQGIRIFDYAKWAEPLRDEIRANAEALAAKNGLAIDHIRKRSEATRKEKKVRAIVDQRGEHPGLVCILSAMEACSSYEPWHNKQTHQTYLRPDSGRCLHYYFYFILEDLGLCYLRVPTWAPFRLQFYCNGHSVLAAQLRKRGIGFEMMDNAFAQIEDWDKAQRLADALRPKPLHKRLDQLARKCCPVIRHFQGVTYHWSLMQAEYATDIVFRRQSDLEPLYEELTRTAIHAVKAEDIATFLGRRLTGGYQDEMGNNFGTRIEGTRIKHCMGKVSIKMYDKFHLILRIETTANDVSFFKHHRQVEHRDGTAAMKNAPLKKTIHSLPILRELMGAANRRYLAFLAAIDDPTFSQRDLDKLSKPASDAERSYRGFNLFDGQDLELLRAINRGEFTISGFQNRDLRRRLPGKKGHQISRLLKRLRKHGLIKKIGRTYKYYLTAFGRRITAVALRLREMFIIPALRGAIQC